MQEKRLHTLLKDTGGQDGQAGIVLQQAAVARLHANEAVTKAEKALQRNDLDAAIDPDDVYRDAGALLLSKGPHVQSEIVGCANSFFCTPYLLIDEKAVSSTSGLPFDKQIRIGQVSLVLTELGPHFANI